MRRADHRRTARPLFVIGILVCLAAVALRIGMLVYEVKLDRTIRDSIVEGGGPQPSFETELLILKSGVGVSYAMMLLGLAVLLFGIARNRRGLAATEFFPVPTPSQIAEQVSAEEPAAASESQPEGERREP
ncbi:hypothetical protein HAHE_29780 [Haloferula helveola]|uniref:Uncharacterized protein n=1 Tax=Haloferula helveola TaxID=490095 RepID=A0ABM7RBR6_9BACT|nr:hypothetical protein HAHE_29780 [Haloferula helveola]